MINIKVNGITDIKQLNQLDGLGIDYAGFFFSKDAVLTVTAAELKKADTDTKKVGVFRDPAMIDVLDAIDHYGLDVVELHGNISEEMCDDLGSEVEVIRAFPVSAGVNIDELVETYDAVCDFYLFQTGDASFDWKQLKASRIEKPFFLSGGFGLDDAATIKAFKHPDFFGVEINEQFEKSPGIKDMVKVLQFKQGLKK
jgi:phosphoribosylanthranilate isomerase